MGMQTMQTQQPMRQSSGKGSAISSAPQMPQLNVPTSLGQGTAQDKAAFYNNALGQGYSDQAIRSAVNGSLGQQSDSDWTALQGLAQQTAQPKPSDIRLAVEPDMGLPMRQQSPMGQPTGKGGGGMGQPRGQQPRFGQPNQYSNTTRPWDNATIAPQYSTVGGGKGGKTGQQASNYPVARTNFSYNPVTAPAQNTAAQNTAPATTNQTTWSGY